jgi:cytochrome b561
MSVARYGIPAITLHWLHAALVVALIFIGLTMVDLPKGGPDRSAAYALHKSLGLCALALIFVRLGWRRFKAPPVAATVLLPWERRLSAGIHHALYLVLVVAPVAGYLSASFTKYPMKLFGLVLPSAGWPDEALNALFSTIHKGAVLTLMFLLALHVLGALHHAFRRDGVMSRMLPWRSGNA